MINKKSKHIRVSEDFAKELERYRMNLQNKFNRVVTMSEASRMYLKDKKNKKKKIVEEPFIKI
jgi:hypothetical protein